MTALEVLEETLQKEQHTSSRAMAKSICRRVIGMLEDGQDPQTTYRALDGLYHRLRDQGRVVERDALVEVLDWFDTEVSPQSA
jgi:hypothetical protein